jgi:hypothetical protein
MLGYDVFIEAIADSIDGSGARASGLSLQDLGYAQCDSIADVLLSQIQSLSRGPARARDMPAPNAGRQ